MTHFGLSAGGQQMCCIKCRLTPQHAVPHRFVQSNNAALTSCSLRTGVEALEKFQSLLGCDDAKT